MTTKRFTYEYDEYSGNLFDNKMNTFYHIEDSDENIEILCDRLNWLVEENERLKKEKLVGEPLELFKQNMLLKQSNKELREENKRLQRCINEIYTIARLEEV